MYLTSSGLKATANQVTDTIDTMRHLGFTETPPKAPGLSDFMIDIESSGIPFLRAYKEVLKNSLQSAQDQVL